MRTLQSSVIIVYLCQSGKLEPSPCRIPGLRHCSHTPVSILTMCDLDVEYAPGDVGVGEFDLDLVGANHDGRVLYVVDSLAFVLYIAFHLVSVGG